jgi:dTDP-4-dehydrorhamnose 3,5-epimerase
MRVMPLAIPGSWIIQSPIYPDDRGMFREWFRSEEWKENGVPLFVVRQANTSISKKGVIRGIHYSSESKGQAKIVTCTSGSVFDVVVDLRPESLTYGEHVEIELSASAGTCVYISSGLGHGFQALENNSVITYLLDKEYSPDEEYGINPVDPYLSIKWPLLDFYVSEKDRISANFNRNNKGKG